VIRIEVGGEALALLPEKAAWLPDHKTLLIADAHIGKAVSFRKLGVPVPQGTTRGMLQQLTDLVARLQAERIVFLGDFLHSAHAHTASTMDTVVRWRAARPEFKLTLVRGNHDKHAGDPPIGLRIEVVDEPLRLGGLALCHHPRTVKGAYALAGHLHPCVSLGGRAHDHLRLPCFHFGPQVGVLPAFGAFTGMHPADIREGDRVYAVAEERVVEVEFR
jgi:DNA ligase-associated metallophosphoesterase